VIGRVGSLFAAHFLDIDTEAGLIAYGDRILLERLLENLLSNAARHTPPGTRVRVSAGAIHDGIVVSVEDTGPGISPEELRHIGEKFFRGGHPDRRASRGTGLGLAFVKKILELHASELRIESRVGQGSRFSFSLAAAQPAGATSRSESSHSRRAASSS
jgi:signal transduction histidine kinase